jgi:hypothetical protein
MHMQDAANPVHIATDYSGSNWDEYFYTTVTNSSSQNQELSYVETGPRELVSTFFSDQHYTVTDAADLRFGTSNFTIEFWIKLGRLYGTGDSYVMGKGGNAARTAGTGWVIYITNQQKIGFYDAVGNTSTQSVTSLPFAGPLDGWAHVAIVRTGTSTNQTLIFINGALDVNGTSTGNFTDTSNLIIGKDRAASGTTHFNGYLFDLRIKATAEYTTSFTAPTAPLNMAGSLFSLSGDRPWHPIYPSLQPEGRTVVCSGNIIRRVEDHPFIVKFPKVTGSGYSSGKVYDRGWQIADFRHPTKNLNLGAGAFTVECWLYFTPGADGGTVGICGKGTGNDATAGATGWNFTINGSNFPAWSDGASTVVAGTVALSTNAWNHVVAVRSGTGTDQFKMYVNGMLSYTGTLSTNYTDTTNPFVLFGSRNYQHNLRGCRIACFKVSDNAVYTSAFSINRNTFFTTAATITANTKLYTLDARDQAPSPVKPQWVNSGYENIPFAAKTWGSTRLGAKALFSSGGYSVQNTEGSSDETLFSSSSNGSFTFNADDFSIEFWYCNNFEWEQVGNATARIFFDNRDSYNGTGLALEYEYRSLRLLSAGRVVLSDQTAYFAQRSWVHVCVQRTSGNLAIYLNGRKSAETYYPNSFSNSTGKMYWMNGAFGVRNDRRAYGWLSDIRVCKPVAAYSVGGTNPEFIPAPTAPLPLTANTVFSTASQQTLRDYSTSNNTLWAGNRSDANYTSSWDVWISPFSPYKAPYTALGSSDSWDSSYCGARAVVDTDNAAWQQHENFWPMQLVRPWTIEYWFYHFQSNPSSITTHTHYYTSTTNNGDGWQFIVNYAGNANSYNDITMIWRLGRLSANTNEWINTSGGNGNIKPHSWNHVAVVFDPTRDTNSRIAMFVNGSRVATRSPFTQSYSGVYYDRLSWGGVHGCGELRISDVARYDNTQATYTVPSSVWESDANTAVLLKLNSPLKNLAGKASHIFDGLVSPSHEHTKWGNGSIRFGNLDTAIANYDRIYLQHYGVWSDRLWDIRYGDFTVEGWANWKDAAAGGRAYPASLACLYHYQDSVWIGINSGGTWQLLGRSGTTTSQTGVTITSKGVALASESRWNHWALVRQAGDYYLYIDGELSVIMYGGNHGTYASGGPTYNKHEDWYNINNSRIGQNNSGTAGEAWTGHLEDLRLTALARYHTSLVDNKQTMCHIGTNIPALPTAKFPTR